MKLQSWFCLLTLSHSNTCKYQDACVQLTSVARITCAHTPQRSGDAGCPVLTASPVFFSMGHKTLMWSLSSIPFRSECCSETSASLVYFSPPRSLKIKIPEFHSSSVFFIWVSYGSSLVLCLILSLGQVFLPLFAIWFLDWTHTKGAP